MNLNTDPRLPPGAGPTRYDPAKDAARLLGWFGLTVLMVAVPLIGIVSRGAMFVLLPVGAAVLAAAYFLSVSRIGLEAMRAAVLSPIGLAALLLAVWAALALVWTPFPESGAPRLLGAVITVLIAVLIIAHIPERRAPLTLYLLPLGLAATAFLTIVLTLVGPAYFHGGSEFDPSLIERSALTLTVLLWPALGALAAFERWNLASGLAALVAAALAAASTPISMASFAIGALVFALAVDAPRRTARIAAGVFCGLVVLAPVLPFILAPIAQSLSMIGHGTVAAMTDWRGLIADDPVRLITGHGLDSARSGELFAFLPPHTPRSILFEIWYDLGVVGALAFAAVFTLGLIAAGDAASAVTPPLLGGMVAALAIALFGVATSEIWFVTLVCLEGIALGLLARCSRTTRPTVQTRPSATSLTGGPDPSAVV